MLLKIWSDGRNWWQEKHVIKEYVTHESKKKLQGKLDAVFNWMLTNTLQNLWDSAKAILGNL